MRTVLARLVLIALVLSGSACAGTDVPGEPALDDAERIERIRALRETLAEPAVSLGRAGQRAGSVVEALRLEPSEAPQDRLAMVASARSQDLEDLAEAIDAAREVRPGGEDADAQAVAAAWAQVIDAADTLRAGADRELELVGRLAAADVELAEVVAVWDEPGSRNQQLEAFAAAAGRADELAADLGALEPPAPCVGDVQRRVDAATAVANATRELRRYVAGHQGNRFDTRRAELAQDPYSLGGPLSAVPVPDCWDVESPTARAGDDLEAALRALEAALNPPELATPDSGADDA